MATAIDLSYLTDQEKAAFRRARRAPAAAYRAGLGTAALWSVPVGGLIWVAVTSADGGFEEWAGLIWIAVWAVGLFGLAKSAIAGAEEAEKLTRPNADDFLRKIKYHERVRSGRRPGTAHVAPVHGDDTGPVKSTRQAQHEWYRGHSELDWRDRQRAETYGMDIDTYINNVLENDKD
jgi:hypothetical protein